MSSIQANVIFIGEASAKLIEFSEDINVRYGHILYAPALTTEVAFYVLHNPVLGIITESSSFATHGANILRYYFTQTCGRIPWVTNVSKPLIKGLLGQEVIIHCDGIVASAGTKSGRSGIFKKSFQEEYISYLPLKKRAIVECNLSKGIYSVCYWPHREFDNLTFSVMRAGLQKNMILLRAGCTGIELDRNGRIWFSNAPLIRDFREMALNIDFAFGILEKQIDMYQKIYTRLHSPVSLKEITQLLIEYFSIFILFHDTYEDVLVDAKCFFEHYMSSSETANVMDMLMWCRLDKWMLDSELLLRKRKKLLSNEKEVPMPDFSISEDIDISLAKFITYIESLGKDSVVAQHYKYVEFYIKFFVAKEWKFIINKILFTRFSQKCQLLPLSFGQLEILDFYQLLDMGEPRDENS